MLHIEGLKGWAQYGRIPDRNTSGQWTPEDVQGYKQVQCAVSGERPPGSDPPSRAGQATGVRVWALLAVSSWEPAC